MLRLKKVHKLLALYSIAAVVLLTLILNNSHNQVLETVLEYENYTWSRLSDEIFILSAYYENRPVENSPFVRVLTISK